MALNRHDPATAIPLLEKQIKELQGDTVTHKKVVDLINENTQAMYRLDLYASDGNFLSDGVPKTVLSAKVVSWDVDITNTIDSKYFRWQRKSDDPGTDEAWNKQHMDGSKTLPLSESDVGIQSTFYCTVDNGDDIDLDASILVMSGSELDRVGHLAEKAEETAENNKEEIKKITVTVTELEANAIRTDELSAKVADLGYLTTGEIDAKIGAFGFLDAESADVRYANIDFANIGPAAIEKLFTDSGIIGDLIMSDGHVTGKLVGVTIIGDLIEGGTVKADKLVIQGEDGLYYKLNTNGETVEAEQTEYNSLNGSIITAQSITAEKINVDDLVAFDATIGGFNITESALYSGVKESVGNTTRGAYLDKDGQVAFGDGSNFLKYYKGTDGKWKLEISANSLTFSGNGTSVEQAITDVNAKIDAIEVGGRNLLLNTNKGVTGWAWTMQVGDKTIAENYVNGVAGVKFTKGTTEHSGWSYVSYSPSYILKGLLEPNEVYTLSFDVRSSVVSSITGVLQEIDTSDPLTNRMIMGSTVANTWVKLSCTLTTVSTFPTSLNQCVYLYGFSTKVGATHEFKNLKLEKGNRATDWTPAPEDTQSQIDDARKVATNHMAFENGKGLVVGDMTAAQLGRNVLIDADSVDIRNGETVLASFGEEVVIGETSKTHTRQSSDKYGVYDADNVPLFAATPVPIDDTTNPLRTFYAYCEHSGNTPHTYTFTTDRIVVSVFSLEATDDDTLESFQFPYVVDIDQLYVTISRPGLYTIIFTYYSTPDKYKLSIAGTATATNFFIDDPELEDLWEQSFG